MDPDEQLRRRLRTLQRIVGAPTDATLARHSNVSAATFSEVMSGRRRPRPEFVTKVVSGCLSCARRGGRAPLDERKVLQALRMPGFTAEDAGILERDEDLGRCSAVFDAVRGGAGATVVVEGAAGIGKSEFLAWLCAEAAVRGVVPLAVRGNQRSRTMAFGAARTLLARWIADRGAAERDTLFAGAAALARIPLGLPHPGHTGTATMIGLTEALYWLVVAATSAPDSRDTALLLAVDDAHWLDDESLHWLEFLGDRLAGLPVVLLLAYRPHEPGLAPELTRIALHANEAVRLRALSRDAVRTMVGRSLGRRPSREPDDRFCAEFLQRSGGNPFYLRWMIDLARERGLAPTASAADEVARLTPRHIVVYLNDRLTALGQRPMRLARAVAVLGPGCPLDHAAKIAGLTIRAAKVQYDRLCKAAILASGPTIDFCHPIIRSAVYDDMSPSARSDTHRAAARLLDERGCDPETVAAHLLDVHAAADPWAVDRLTAAAATAMRSGLSATAARYLQRAVAEPPPRELLGHVRLRYGQALTLGEVATAVPQLLAAYRDSPDEELRTSAAVALAKAYGYADRLGDGVRMLDDAIDRCADERARERLLTEQLLWAIWWAEDPRRQDRMRLLARIASPLSGDTHGEHMLVTLYAWSLVLRGVPRAAALAAVRPVVRAGVTFADGDHGMELATMTAFVLVCSEQLPEAERLFHQAIAEFHRDGWRGTHLAFARTNLANVALRQGRLADAVADAEIALRAADRAGTRIPAQWFATGNLIEALIARGEIDRAAAVCARRGFAGPQPDALIFPVPRAVVGALALARGDTAGAIATLREIGQWLTATHMTNPAWCGWHFDLARALRRSAPDEADQIASAARQQADRFGNPSIQGRALRTLAALRPTSAVDLLEESANVLREAQNRCEYARSLADLGAALVRTGRQRDARRPLTEALALADECAAPALHTAVSQQLGRTGSTPNPPSRLNSLHPRQRRIAELAAAGCSDAEIAYQMVLDQDTVATLLRDACDRLGVPARSQLGRLFTPG